MSRNQCSLTKPKDSDIVLGRKYGEYECPGDGRSHTWISLNAQDQSCICRDHNVKATPIIVRDLCYGDYPADKQLYGYFNCPHCKGKNWGSAYTWKGYSQDCNKCRISLYTLHLNYIRRGGGGNNSSHCKELCEKCRIVGDCRLSRQ